MRSARDPRAEAAAWCARLSRPRVDNDALHAFFLWRRHPANRAAFEAETKAFGRRESRFVAEPDGHGFTVRDRETGEPATFARRRQTGIPEADAEDIAEILNRRALVERTCAN